MKNTKLQLDAMNWFSMQTPEYFSKIFDIYYISSKRGLNLNEVVNLYKRETGYQRKRI